MGEAGCWELAAPACASLIKQLHPFSGPQFTWMRNGGAVPSWQGAWGSHHFMTPQLRTWRHPAPCFPSGPGGESSLSCPFPPPPPVQGSGKSA